MPKELKKYELKACPRPLNSGRYKLISNTFAVNDKVGTPGYAYVSFSDAFVHAVGCAVGGVMDIDPAIITVSLLEDSHYVYAGKMNKTSKLLFIGEGHPQWLKFHKLKVKQDGHEKKPYGAGKKRLSPRDDGGPVKW